MIRDYIHEIGADGLPSWLEEGIEREWAAAFLALEGDRKLASWLADKAENKWIEAGLYGSPNEAEAWMARYYQAEEYERAARKQPG